MKRLLLVLPFVLALPLPTSAYAAEADPQPTAEQAAKLTEHLGKDFAVKVVEPAVQRMLQRLFANQRDIEEEVQDAVVSALSKQSKNARELLIEMIEALNNRDRAAFDTAARTTVSLRSAIA